MLFRSAGDAIEALAANAPNGTPCALPDKCLDGVACSGGACVGSPRVCVPSGPCRTAECDPATGACSEGSLPVGTPCSAGDACSLDGACAADGTCDAPSLADGTPCELKASCADGAAPACRVGRCRCPGDLDEPDLGATAADLGAATPPDERGCAIVARRSGSSAGALLAVTLLVLVRRRRPAAATRATRA